MSSHIAAPKSVGIIPTGKFVVKINLANMVSHASMPAYPDPLLLAYKSSINWTRLRGFQLMAEAEPIAQGEVGGGSNREGISEHSLPEEVLAG